MVKRCAGETTLSGRYFVNTGLCEEKFDLETIPATCHGRRTVKKSNPLQEPMGGQRGGAMAWKKAASNVWEALPPPRR